MVTTKRATEEFQSVYNQGGSMGGVGLLERNVPNSYKEYTSAPVVEEGVDAAKERMQRNLDRLLNYDRYNEEQASAAVVEDTVVEEVVDQGASLADEDIRPTSTTMQFGDGDIDQMYKEMNKQQTSEEASSGYKLNGKGKLILVLYALAVTVILALIVINTGVLASLSNTNQAKVAELNATMEEYNVLSAEIDSISNSDYIIDVAQNKYGMVKGN